MSKETTLATFKISPVLWDGFKLWATTHSTNAAEVLRWLIKECIDGRVTAPSGEIQGATVGLNERIALQVEESIAALEFRLDKRTSERLEPLLGEVAELRAMVEALQLQGTNPAPQKMEDIDPPNPVMGIPMTRLQHCLPIKGMPETEPIAPAAVDFEGSDRTVSDSHARTTAKKLGWSKSLNVPVTDFLGDRGWVRHGDKNTARWSPPDSPQP
jgi:hypothetical protein